MSRRLKSYPSRDKTKMAGKRVKAIWKEYWKEYKEGNRAKKGKLLSRDTHFPAPEGGVRCPGRLI